MRQPLDGDTPSAGGPSGPHPRPPGTGRGIRAWLRIALFAALIQVYGAGLWLFAGLPGFHPTFGYVVLLILLVQWIWVMVIRMGDGVRGLAAVSLVLAVAAPAIVLLGPDLGGPLASTHPLVGVLLVLVQYEMVRRT